jgi:hypothetical protein
LVAQTIVQHKASALENHALGEIQNWRDADEAIVNTVRAALRTGAPLAAMVGDNKVYAAHLVAGAVVETLSTGAGLPTIHARLISLLNAQHDQNPSWGPLLVRQPGNIVKDFIYKRPLAELAPASRLRR